MPYKKSSTRDNQSSTRNSRSSTRDSRSNTNKYQDSRKSFAKKPFGKKTSDKKPFDKKSFDKKTSEKDNKFSKDDATGKTSDFKRKPRFNESSSRSERSNSRDNSRRDERSNSKTSEFKRKPRFNENSRFSKDSKTTQKDKRSYYSKDNESSSRSKRSNFRDNSKRDEKSDFKRKPRFNDNSSLNEKPEWEQKTTKIQDSIFGDNLEFEPSQISEQDAKLLSGVEPRDLSKEIFSTLVGLGAGNREVVAKYLVLAYGQALENPLKAYDFAYKASKRAGRIAVVRQICGTFAYTAEQYKIAITELKAYQRISGKQDCVDMVADSFRALNKPRKALDEIIKVDTKKLDHEGIVELAIVHSGVRCDLGEYKTAQIILQQLKEQLKLPKESWLNERIDEALENICELKDIKGKSGK